MKPIHALAFVLALASASLTASAAERGYSRSSSSSSAGQSVSVPVAGSIAMPGANTATYTNPAGLIGTSDVKLSLQGGSKKPTNDPSLRALLLAGNGMFAASAGVKYNMYDVGDDYGYAVYGLAVNVAPLDFTLGVSGITGIKTAEGNDFNAGFLFRPTSFITIGGTAMSLQGDINSIGAGLGLELLDGVFLVGDAAFNSKFKEAKFKPGLKVANSYAGLSVSYGTGATSQFAKDFSGAAFLKISANSEFEFEYNHGGDLPKYFASLSLGF